MMKKPSTADRVRRRGNIYGNSEVGRGVPGTLFFLIESWKTYGKIGPGGDPKIFREIARTLKN